MRIKRLNVIRKKWLIVGVVLAAVIGVSGLLVQDHFAKKVDIVSDAPVRVKTGGKIITGKNRSDENKLSSVGKLVYESKEIESNRPTANAVYLTWDQRGESGSVTPEVRTFNGVEWSEWYETGTDESERPDHITSVKPGAFLISDNIHKVQYRMTLESDEGQSSPEVDLNSLSMQTIDATQGPSTQRKTALESVVSFLGFGAKAEARVDGPRIISRAEWGNPEADNPEWQPEYAPLNRIVIHHTAVVPGSDSAAAVRAVWQYHAKSLGWGDIGYNYLVDQSGTIYEGRYSNKQYAEENNVDVIGGHVYGNNVGTSGISALGNFENMSPTTSLIHSMGEMAAFKGGSYGLNPAEGTTHGGNLLGHRDLLSTSCPGRNLYANIQTIRDVANALFPKYNIPDYSWRYVTQYSYSDEERKVPLSSTQVTPGQRVYVTVQAVNTGRKPWRASGENPVRLGTSRPADRVSAFCDDWLGCGRPTSLKESIVKPGQMGSFEFSLVAPNNPTLNDWTAKEYFTPLAEGKMWMNDPGLYWQFDMVKPYSWQYVTQTAHLNAARTVPINLNTTAVEGGQKIYLSVSAKNTGSQKWLATGPNPIRLGASNPHDRLSSFCDPSWISCGRVVGIQGEVNPGETGKFEFVVTVPQNPSTTEKVYKEYFTPLAEGKTWMNDPGLYWLLKVEPSN